MDTTKESQVVLSLCTGMRGLERGIERSIGPVTIAAYVEIEAFIIFNLVRQMEQGLVDAVPVWTDIKTFPAEQFYRKVHGIIGGYPCQPFSVAGKQKGVEDERHLWPFIKSHIETIRPDWCFFENVANHVNIGYREVRQELEGLGYTVKEGIFTAQEVGAPHKRERLFILAVDRTQLAHSHSLRRTYCELEKQPAETGQHAFSDAAAGRGDGLENTHSESVRQNFGGVYGEVARTSAELAHGNISGLQRQLQAGVFNQERWQEQSNGHAGPSRGNRENVADADNGRGGENCEQTEFRASGAEQSPSNSWTASEGEDSEGRFDRWPAGAGPQQHEWEEPRTVEPGLGCTINGYNFRTDLLRMYGNGVVEQTAEIAFIDLMNKHFND